MNDNVKSTESFLNRQQFLFNKKMGFLTPFGSFVVYLSMITCCMNTCVELATYG